jgi:hypothetical protein
VFHLLNEGEIVFWIVLTVQKHTFNFNVLLLVIQLLQGF